MNYWNVSPTFAVSLSCHYPFYLIFSPSFHSIVQSLNCVRLCNPMDCSIPVFPVLNYFSELAQTHVHWVDDAIQPSHPLSSPSPPALVFPDIRVFSNASVHHIRWPKYWSFSFSSSPTNEYSGLIPFRIDLCDLLAVQGTLKNLHSVNHLRYATYLLYHKESVGHSFHPITISI